MTITELIERLQDFKDKEGDMWIYATYLVNNPSAIHGLTMYQTPIMAIVKTPSSIATILHCDGPETMARFMNSTEVTLADEL